MKSDDGSPDNEPVTISRNELIRYNMEIINDIRARIRGPRFKAQDSDPIKIRYMQTMIMGLKCANEILKDIELSEIKEELEALRADLERQAGPGAYRAGYPNRGLC